MYCFASKTNTCEMFLFCFYNSQSKNRWQRTVSRRLLGEKRKCLPGVYPPRNGWAAERGRSSGVGRWICYTESGAKLSPRVFDTVFCELFTPRVYLWPDIFTFFSVVVRDVPFSWVVCWNSLTAVPVLEFWVLFLGNNLMSQCVLSTWRIGRATWPNGRWELWTDRDLFLGK